MARNAPALRVDGRRVDPQAFYAAACDPARSCVVEACAGSGKTWMLVSRMLRALLDGTPPHEILAITFTRAAAGEMRERLDKWLAEFSTPRSSHDQRVHALVDGLAEDLRRLREGAALPPLGEGSACAHCDARGLCRRDHWSVDSEAPLDADAEGG